MSYYAPTTTRSRPGVSVVLVAYLVAGGIIAATHHYWSNLHTLKAIISALLATILWPLIFAGVNLHIH
jgi:cell shape-determining protein MreD